MKNLPLLKPVILLFALLPLLCHAQIYTWKDENGTIHYGDAKNKPGNVKADKVSLKINTYEGVEVDSIATSTQKVEMFSTSWCGYCKQESPQVFPKKWNRFY